MIWHHVDTLADLSKTLQALDTQRRACAAEEMAGWSAKVSIRTPQLGRVGTQLPVAAKPLVILDDGLVDFDYASAERRIMGRMVFTGGSFSVCAAGVSGDRVDADGLLQWREAVSLAWVFTEMSKRYSVVTVTVQLWGTGAGGKAGETAAVCVHRSGRACGNPREVVRL